MSRLGLSLYPEKSTFDEDINYLKLGQQLGYQRLFMSFLQLALGDVEQSILRFKETVKQARLLGYDITVDVHPYVFEYLKIKPDDLSYFHQLDIQVIRLDAGFSGKEEAMMTHNPYGIKVELNMSQYNHHLEKIMDYHPNTNHLTGSHNFFPQRFTGLPLHHFIKCNQHFKQYHLQTAAFIHSQSGKVGPWPVQEGMCTLEIHRDKCIEAQVLEMKLLGDIDDLIVADMNVSKEELTRCAEVFYSHELLIKVDINEDINDLERKILFDHIHHYREDINDYAIRSTRLRRVYQECKLPMHHTKDIKRGDILILNEDYGQYKAEMQIALKDRVGDPRINVVGHVHIDYISVLDLLKPGQNFKLGE